MDTEISSTNIESVGKKKASSCLCPGKPKKRKKQNVPKRTVVKR